MVEICAVAVGRYVERHIFVGSGGSRADTITGIELDDLTNLVKLYELLTEAVDCLVGREGEILG